MKKDAYYFPHFCNARNDSKILKLRRVLGIEGYGIYFMLLEVLREQTDFRLPLSAIDDLEFEFRISKEKITTVITNYDLFEVVDTKFFSPKLVHFLQPYIEKTDRARSAALTRWNKTREIDNGNQLVNANADANALQMNMQGEERRGKENIKNNIPELQNDDIKENFNINQEAAASRTQRSDFILLEDGKCIFEYDSPIPDKMIADVIRYIKAIKGVDVSKEKVLDFWNIFRDLQIDRKNSYDRPEDGYTHFFNWSAGRPLPKERRASVAASAKPTNGKPKNGSVHGVKFSPDFLTCEMSDGSTVTLNQNQSDQARYGQINPKVIKP
jgi:hypothetical protein